MNSKIDIISHLKRDDYNYMANPVGDGVTDDAPIIQRRINAGLPAFGSCIGGRFFIGTTINVGTGHILNGKKSTRVLTR